MDDSALLRRYAENRSDEAFASLVERHVNLVYSVAMRCVWDAHDAEEVTQNVFILLAKKASQLRHDKALSSWLFQTTRLTAQNYLRSESRRNRREMEAHMQSASDDSASDIWPRIEPLLDEAVAGLDEVERHAIVLRFYEGRSLRDVGAALGSSEDAAQKRVSRAVERLREFFAKRGVSVGASGLAVVLSANAVQAAPTSLAAEVSMAIQSETTLAGAMRDGLGSVFALRIVVILLCVSASVAVPFLIHLLSDGRLKPRAETQHEQGNGWFGRVDLQEGNVAAVLEYGSPEYWKVLHRMAAGKTKDAFILSTALTQYVAGQTGMFPTNFDSIAMLLEKLPAMTGTNEFEIVYSGSIEGLKKRKPASLMIIRDQITWSGPTGKRTRVYGMLGGIAEIAESDDNFDAWEKRHRL